ncbi:MAG TPA: hypothetical protein VF865_07380 [Acidobacteriaceae bacterium]
MADQTSPEQEKSTNSDILRDLAQTFSDEAQAAAKKRAIEQNYPLDRGDIPFEETLINLGRNRDVLLKSIEASALPQLPLKIQSSLIADARKVSAQLTALIGGTDAVLPFESAVDDLTASIWYSNLQNMSGEVLGLHEKLNQLKALERELRQLNDRAKSFKASEERAASGLERLDQALIAVEGSVGNLAAIVQEAQKQFDMTKDSEQKVVGFLTVAQQNEKGSAESAATARAASAEVDSLRTRADTAVLEVEQTRSAYASLTNEITAFKGQTEAGLKQAQETQEKGFKELTDGAQAEFTRLSKVAEEREEALVAEVRAAEAARVLAAGTQLAASKAAFDASAAELVTKNKEALGIAEKRATTIIDESEIKTKERFEELEKLEDIIREKIRLATNFQLFHAFQTRQMDIAVGKKFWRNSLFGFVGVSFALSVLFIVYLFIASPSYNAAFYLKLSISIPLIYAIHFCSTEYSKERKLEEEYAFKGNISISLEPYRELVEKMIDKNNPEEVAKYSDFVIASIDKVFTSPMQQVVGTTPSKKDDSAVVDETSKGLTKIVGSISDLVQSLIKIKS